jgi:hypothetical protein
MGRVTVLILALLAVAAFAGTAYAEGDCGGAPRTALQQIVLDTSGDYTPIPPKTGNSGG